MKKIILYILGIIFTIIVLIVLSGFVSIIYALYQFAIL